MPKLIETALLVVGVLAIGLILFAMSRHLL